MITLIAPVRGRYDDTVRTLNSVYETASSPKNIEVILRIDNDDAELKDKKWPQYPNFRVLTGDRYLGYSSLYRMVNESAVHASGDIIMFLSNDVRFLTKNWDKEYETFLDKCYGLCVIQVKKNGKNGPATQFPAITKKLFNLLGYFSMSPSLDDYIALVGIKARCMFHSNLDLEHDYTKGDYIAEQKEESVPFIRQEYRSKPVQALIVDDAKLVSMIIGELEAEAWVKENFG